MAKDGVAVGFGRMLLDLVVIKALPLAVVAGIIAWTLAMIIPVSTDPIVSTLIGAIPLVLLVLLVVLMKSLNKKDQSMLKEINILNLLLLFGAISSVAFNQLQSVTV